MSVEPFGRIFLDDSLLTEKAAQYRLNCDTGAHVVRFECAEAINGEYQETVLVRPQQETQVSHAFAVMSPANVTVTVEPRGDVYVDDRLIERDCQELRLPLEAGTHVFRIEHDGAVTPILIDTVSVATGESIPLSYAFELVSDSGQVIIGSNPLGADIYIDGQLQDDQTPYTFTLKSGSYHLKVALSDLSAVEETTLTIEPGGKHRFVGDLKR